ncbi:MAG: pitrilysin family protein [Patescibacteria group bacterium]
MTESKLNNGIRAFIDPTPGTSAVTILVMVKLGSRYETPALSGASHFIEHMMFKGTKNLPTPMDVARSLDAIGADYNAYTSKEYTGYYIKGDVRHAKFAIDTLYDMTFASVYNKEEMDRERGVIIEEINMYEDTPVRHIEDILEEEMFRGNSLGWEIAGSATTMKTMAREAVMALRDRFYVPSRMTVCAAGNVSAEVIDWLDGTFGHVKDHGDAQLFERYGVFPLHDAPPIRMQKKKTEQVHLGLGFPGLAYTDERLAAMKVLTTLLGGNMSSRLFMSVREKGGLAYRINAGHSEYEDTGIVAILAGLNGPKLSEATQRIFAELEDLKAHGPTDEEMQRTKEYLRGQMLLAMEDSSVRAEWYAKRGLFYETVATPEERIAALQAVTREELQTLARDTFDRKRMAVSYIGAAKSEDDVRAAIISL